MLSILGPLKHEAGSDPLYSIVQLLSSPPPYRVLLHLPLLSPRHFVHRHVNYKNHAMNLATDKRFGLAAKG